jgi:hypothetical protein
MIRGSVCLQVIRFNVNCLTHKHKQHVCISTTTIAKRAMLPSQQIHWLIIYDQQYSPQTDDFHLLKVTLYR